MILASPSLHDGGSMNISATQDIRTFLLSRRELETELMVRKALTHSNPLDVSIDNQHMITLIEQRLLLWDAMMALLTEPERLIVEQHVLEGHDWPIVMATYQRRWQIKDADMKTQRSFQVWLSKALKKLDNKQNQLMSILSIQSNSDLDTKF